jgi:hypothetical protein
MPNQSSIFGLGATLGLILIVLAGYILFATRPTTPPPTPATVADPTSLPGIATGTVPWLVELEHLKERLAADSLPALSEEGEALHIHQHLDLYVHGTQVPLPAGIGVDEGAGFISPIHVHDDTNIIHVESPYTATFTLGEFFDVWGVRFTQDCIGSYCTSGDDVLKVFVNGAPYTGNPRLLALDVHQEIVVSFGTEAELPSPLPATYSFPAGY